MNSGNKESSTRLKFTPSGINVQKTAGSSRTDTETDNLRISQSANCSSDNTPDERCKKDSSKVTNEKRKIEVTRKSARLKSRSNPTETNPSEDVKTVEKRLVASILNPQEISSPTGRKKATKVRKIKGAKHQEDPWVWKNSGPDSKYVTPIKENEIEPGHSATKRGKTYISLNRKKFCKIFYNVYK